MKTTAALLIAILLLFQASLATTGSRFQNLNADQVQVLRSDSDQIDLNLNANQLEYSPDLTAEELETQLWQQGFGIYREAGKPTVPAVSQWIVLPEGKTARVANAESDPNLFPATATQISQTMRLRHLNLAQVTAFPVRVNLETGQLVQSENVLLAVRFEDDLINRQAFRNRTPSPHFQRLIESMTVNPAPHRDDQELVAARGYYEYYLFVVPDYIDGEDREGIEELIYMLVDWKRRAGNKVEVLWIPEGEERDADQIKPHIQDRYYELLESGEEPFDNILLIGEEELSPQLENRGGQGMEILLASQESEMEQDPWIGHWDLWYGYLEGEDLLADVAVSRFHAGDAKMLANGVHKTLGYESQPSLDDPTWFTEAVVEQEDLVDAGISVSYTADCLVHILEHNHKTVVDQYRPGNEQIPGFWLADQINQGISFIAGRAVNERGARYQNDHLDELYDVVGSYPIALLNSGHGEHSMEGLFWVGREFYEDPGHWFDPSGAKGCVATTCTWATPSTIPNNCITMSMAHSMLDLRLSFGWSRLWTLMNFAKVYPGNMGQFEKYSTDFQLCGDVGLEQWEGVPTELSMTVSPLVTGSSYFKVRISDEEDRGVSGVRVTLYKGFRDEVELFEVLQTTGPTGELEFYLVPDLEGPITVTAVGQDLYPMTREINREERDVYLHAGLIAVDDSEQGNGDGEINLQEVVTLSISASNLGANQTARNVQGVLRSVTEGVVIVENDSEFGDIAAGEVSDQTAQVNLQILDASLNGKPILLVMDFRSDDGTWSSALTVTPQTPLLSMSELPNGGIIEAGETELTLPLGNLGLAPTSEFTAELVSRGLGVSISNAVNYGVIEPGGIGNPDGNFLIRTHPDLIPGSKVPLTLTLTANEQVFQELTFNVQIGVSAVTDPLGPDSYGYYAFDNSDTEYEKCPDVEWTEISPLDGDAAFNGTPVEIIRGDRFNGFGEIELPFTFRYYGQDYDSIMVCTNGFIVMGTDPLASPTFQNLPLTGGGAGAPYGMIAPYWDNLAPNPQLSRICTVYDDEFDVFIIEWYNVYFNASQTAITFQIQLRDPAAFPTRTGDGEFVFLYNRMSIQAGTANETPYATVGMTDPEGTTGLEYAVSNVYPVPAAPIVNRRTILFTTDVEDFTSFEPPSAGSAPQEFSLDAVYPNPFNATVKMEFTLDKSGPALVRVFDLRGREVHRLANEPMAAGNHSLTWHALDNPAGLYIIRVEAGNRAVSRKIVLVK